MKTTATLLAEVEVFSELEERELEQVAQVAVPRSFERGEVIFREGDSGDTCYVIRSGSVSIRREHLDGRMLALAELRAGAMFGELAMFGRETRSATAEALEPTAARACSPATCSGAAIEPRDRREDARRARATGCGSRTSACCSSPSRPWPGGWRPRC